MGVWPTCSLPVNSQHLLILNLDAFWFRFVGNCQKASNEPPHSQNGAPTTLRIRSVSHGTGPACRNPFSCPFVREGSLFLILLLADQANTGH